MKSRFLITVTALLASLLALCGCEWLTQLDRSRSAEFARLDHRACEARGYTWPGKAYVDCRRFQADDRQRERWKELQMTRQQQPLRGDIGIQARIEPYRPIREENFGCDEARGADGMTIIACGETDN
ncbi:MAG TPA: hypothetical protein VF275_13085 [Gammaproteobacteria bacterium]